MCVCRLIRNSLKRAKNLRAVSLGNALPLMNNVTILAAMCPVAKAGERTGPLAKAIDALLGLAEASLYAPATSDLGASVESLLLKQVSPTEALLAVVLRQHSPLDLEAVLGLLKAMKLPVQLTWSILADQMYRMTARGTILMGQVEAEAKKKNTTLPSRPALNEKSETTKARLQSSIEAMAKERRDQRMEQFRQGIQQGETAGFMAQSMLQSIGEERAAESGAKDKAMALINSLIDSETVFMVEPTTTARPKAVMTIETVVKPDTESKTGKAESMAETKAGSRASSDSGPIAQSLTAHHFPTDDRLTVSSTQMCSCGAVICGKETRVALFISAGPSGPAAFITNDTHLALFTPDPTLTIPQCLVTPQPHQAWILTLIEAAPHIQDVDGLEYDVVNELALPSSGPSFYYLNRLLSSVAGPDFVRYHVGPAGLRAEYCRTRATPKAMHSSPTGFTAVRNDGIELKDLLLPVIRSPAEYGLVAPWCRTEVSWHSDAALAQYGQGGPLAFLVRLFHSRQAPAHLADRLLIHLMEQQEVSDTSRIFPDGINGFRVYASAIIPGSFCVEVTLNTARRSADLPRLLAQDLLPSTFQGQDAEHMYAVVKRPEIFKAADDSVPDYSLLVDDAPAWLLHVAPAKSSAMTSKYRMMLFTWMFIL